MKRLLLSGLRAYKAFVSPLLPPACRFSPTCSEYAYEAVARHGAVKGSWLAAKRLARCHPFTRGGFDPVPERA
jgi:putative membrane protein insertion efficiency factor